MPTMAIVFGIILILQGLVTLPLADKFSPTIFIPSIFGALLFICGMIGRKADLRKHAMHAAAMVSLLGAAGGLGMGISKIAAGKEIHLAIASQLIMGVLCLIFLVLCIRSFIAARRARTAAEVQ